MWYHAQNETQHGPLTEADVKSLLAQNVITPKTLVWRDGMGEWLPLEQTELAKSFEVPLEGDSWETCSYSGDRAKRSEMFQLEGCWVANEHREDAAAFVAQGGWLPRARSGLLPDVNLDLVPLVAKAYELLAPCVKPVCLVFLLTSIPLHFLLSWLPPLVASSKTDILLLSMALGAVFNSFATGGIVYLFSQQSRGVRPDIGQGITAAFSFWGRLLLMQFVIITATMAGSLLIIPGIIIALRTSLSNIAAVERRMLPPMAVRQSWLVTEGHAWRTLGYFLVVASCCVMPGMLISSMLVLLAPDFALSPAGTVLEALFSLPAVYFMSFQFCYYKELETLHQAQAGQATARASQ